MTYPNTEATKYPYNLNTTYRCNKVAEQQCNTICEGGWPRDGTKCLSLDL